MLVPVNWIKKYVDIDMDTRDLADALTLSGSHVESIESLNDNLANIVVGRIEQIQTHPDADKLVVCQVDVGDEVLQIVTGAPNVEEGAYVIVAKEGAVMADGLVIEKTELRGQPSQGMCCSYQELGLTDSVIPRKYRDGVVLLNEDLVLGSPIDQALGFDDEVLELEITPNRPDCLSMIGVGRELAAATDRPFSYPEVEISPVEGQADFHGQVDTDKCPQLVLRAIEGVSIAESPLWLQSYLMRAGMRPINNIVDITNFVMLEYGQPLHAYDLDKLDKASLIVAEAEDGDELVSLDEQTRKLEEGDIIIRDGSRIIGLAGIMGGLDTEVTDETTNILLESAAFDSSQIRKTSARLGLRSEASSRFEKGVALALQEPAVDRALGLAQEIGAGRPVEKIVKLEGQEASEAQSISMAYDRVNELLGTSLDKDQMVDYLQRLHFTVEDQGDKALVTAPSFRLDIEIEEDLIEEVGRIYGFHKIQPEPIRADLVQGEASKEKDQEYKLKNDLFGLGYSEVLTYSFVSPSLNGRAGVEDEDLNDFIKIENPLGEEFSVMRTLISPNHIAVLSRNINNGCQKMRTFELGNVFLKADELDDIEKRRLAMTGYGDLDFYKFKADFVELMARAGIGDVSFKAREDLKLFHPGRCAEMQVAGRLLGYMGELSYETREEFDIEPRAYALEADLDLINELTLSQKTYEEVSKYPSIIRDISIVVDEDLTHDELVVMIKAGGHELIKSIQLVDIYTGQQIEAGKKSLTYELVYQAKDRTLVDEEVNEIQEKIIASLAEEDIHLRK